MTGTREYTREPGKGFFFSFFTTWNNTLNDSRWTHCHVATDAATNEDERGSRGTRDSGVFFFSFINVIMFIDD